jgi:hypothetical protein
LSLEPWVLQHHARILKEGEYSVKDITNALNKTIVGVGRHDKYVIFRVINECKISEGHCVSVKLLI